MMHPTMSESAPCPGFTKALGQHRQLRYQDVSPDVLAREAASEWAIQAVATGWWENYLRRVLPPEAAQAQVQG